MVLVLLGAALIAIFLGEGQDSVAILIIVFLNAVLGFTQEYRADKAVEALRSLAAPNTTVRRHGHILSIPTEELVPRDVVQLEEGGLIPVDLRLIETVALQINESTLTGASIPVHKNSQSILSERVPVADQKNMAFKGTVVSSGRAIGVVVRTGMSTELGKIANLLRTEIEVETPIQKESVS